MSTAGNFRPRYRITECCDSSNSGEFTYATGQFTEILIGGTGEPYVYLYTGADQTLGGVDFKQNSCYIVVRLLEGPEVTLGPGFGNYTAFFSDTVNNDCEDPGCPDCDPGLYVLTFTGCCDDEVLYFKGTGPGGSEELSQNQQVNYSEYLGLLDFIGTPVNGLIDQCYTVEVFTVEAGQPIETLAEWQDLPSPPIFQGNFDLLNKLPLCDPAGDGTSPCIICDEVCYRVWNCDGEFFDTTNDLSADVFTGSNFVTLAESGTPLPGSWIVLLNEGLCDNAVHTISVTGAAPDCECTCYEVTGNATEITYIDCEGVFTKVYGPAKFCSLIVPLITGDPLEYQLTTGDACVDGECVDECFILTNCEPAEYPDQDAVLNSTLQSLSQYANTNEVVVLAGYEGCWTVTTATCNCITITIDGTVIETTLWGTHNGNPVFSFVYLGITYYIWFQGDWFIYTSLPGDFTGVLMAAEENVEPCPVTSGTFVWDIFLGGISTLTTELCADQCNCPVDVTVIRDYEDCEDCLGITAYKLTNCEKINEVVYTTQDLSAYVGQVLKDDCNCWTVEEIDYQPPSETTIVDPFLYTDCTSCLTTYYQLDNCDPAATPLQIITSTDLSDSVGQVIKIENCDDCFTVSEYTDDPEPTNWEEVTLIETFADCPTCQTLTPQCSTVFNNSTVDRTYRYIDVNGNIQETEIVRSGHTSLRYCVQRWTLTEECTCLTVTIRNTGENTIEVIEAVATGAIYTGRRVYSFEYDGTTYEIWYDTSFPGSEGWYITGSAGSFAPPFLGSALNAIECPIIGSLDDPFNTDPDGWESALEGLIITTTTCIVPIYNYCGDCSVYNDGEGGQTGFCVQYFPNNRKVKPGYNTPICSADKYDKITCKFAEIAYKKVLELRYGISNCCPEEDEKWLIKKELIELQALTDPNYTCDPLTDCCGNPASQCSCNS